MRTLFLTGTLVLLTAGSAFAGPPQPASAASAASAQPPASTAAPASASQVVAPEPLPERVTSLFTGSPETRPFDTTGPRVWANGDYMSMWYTPMRTVPLVRLIPSAQAMAGSSNVGGVTVFPSDDNRIQFDGINGLRAQFGVNWQKFGFDVGGFALERQTETGSFFNDGTPVAVAQGYVSAGMGNPTPASLFASLPGQYSGGVQVVARSWVYGFEGGGRLGWYALFNDATDLLVGFKYLDLSESLVINSPSFFPDGSVVSVSDSIRTRNTFYGGYVGFNGRIGGDERGIGFDFTTKSGLGGVAQRVDLVGSNSIVPAGGMADVQAGGLYARGLNFGTFKRDKFAYVQDLDLKLTYNFNRWVQVSFGYSLTFLTSVARPGRAIDGVINDSNIRFVAQPTPSNEPRPSFVWRAEEFVLQGMTAGLRVQY